MTIKSNFSRMDNENRVIKQPKTLFQQQLNEIMADDPSKQLISDLIHMQMHKNAEKDERMLILIELFNMIGLDNFINIIDLIDGRPVKFPTREDFKDTIEIAICYYYKNFQNYDWSKIDGLLEERIKTKKMSSNIRQLERFMKERVEYLQGRINNGRKSD